MQSLPTPVLYASFRGRKYRIASFADASAKLRGVIESANIGASEACRCGLWPLRLTDADGRAVAHVSYNGKVWAGEPSVTEARTLLFSPKG